jgi:pimeloyl-ACP methyl ester carboxylesterase
MPLIEVAGGTLAYEVHGPPRDPALVLLHGLGSSSTDWAPQVAAFETSRAIVTVDLAGHGASPPSRAFPTVETMARDVEAILDGLGVRTADVIGLSLGGCVALALALRAPARVRSLVLVNAFARLRPAGPRAAARMLARFGLLVLAPMSVLGAFVARDLFPGPDQAGLRSAAAARIAGSGRRAYLTAIAALVRFDARRRLGEVRCPTLVVAGKRDPTIPMAAKEALAQGIPAARLVVVPDSGHVTNWDQTAAFNRIVGDFLARR